MFVQELCTFFDLFASFFCSNPHQINPLKLIKDFLKRAKKVQMDTM